jgi:filamentous hemagglutinin
LLAQSRDPASEGATGRLSAYLEGLKEARTMLAPYAGQPIILNGKVELSNGAAQTYFEATSAQRADSWSNRVLGEIPSPIVSGVLARDEQRLERFGAINGAAAPDYTVEDLLLGGALQNRLVGVAARVWTDMEVALAGKAVSSASGNISARQLTEMGMQATLTSGERDMLQQAAAQSSTSLKGQVSEYVTDSYFARNGYRQIEGKCGADNCFDSVFVRGDKVYVAETKPLGSDGSIKLNGPNPSTRLDAQMTDAWIDGAIARLKTEGTESARATAQLIQRAKDNGSLVKLVAATGKDGLVFLKLK